MLPGEEWPSIEKNPDDMGGATGEDGGDLVPSSLYGGEANPLQFQLKISIFSKFYQSNFLFYIFSEWSCQYPQRKKIGDR